MVRTVVLAALLMVVGPGLATAQVVDIEGRYWLADVDGSAKVESGSIPGTRVDLDDLGVDDEHLPELRITFSTGLNGTLRLAYLYGSFQGDTTIDRSFQFAGATFAASSRVETDIELHYGRLGWAWQFIAVPGIFRIGPLVELKGIVVDASLRSLGPGPTTRETAVLPMVFPTLGAMANLTPVRSVDLFVEVSGVPFGDLGHVVDAEAGVRYRPVPLVAISAGYRLFDARVGKNDTFGELNLSGPFVGASLRF